MNILNLGAGGFIGAHLSNALLLRGHRVTGVDTHTDKIEDLLDRPGFAFLEADIRDEEFDLDGLTAEADVVVDLIAHANPSIYVSRPLDVFQLNFMENLKIARACVRQGKRLVQFSSCEVYGKTAAASLPGRLKDPEDPALAVFSEDTTDFILGPVGKHRWIYSCAKQLLERVLHAHGLAGELNYSIIRPFNIIGPMIDYLPGQTDGAPRVFSYFMEALLTGGEMKLVDGGKHKRCYMDVGEFAQCAALIVENKGGVCDRQIFNIGAPQNEVSIRELAELMREIYVDKFKADRSKLPAIVTVSSEEFYGRGYEDSDRRIPDISKAKKLLGWTPVMGVRQVLERSMAYYIEEHRNLHSTIDD